MSAAVLAAPLMSMWILSRSCLFFMNANAVPKVYFRLESGAANGIQKTG